MQPSLDVHYTNGQIVPFHGTKIYTESNLRRWAVAEIKNQDVSGAVLNYTNSEGLSDSDTYGILIGS
jgi:hypothetical protein